MRYHFTIAVALLVSLSGCAAALSALSLAGQNICARQEAARVALDLALTNAAIISDPVIRANGMDAIRVSLAALDYCPD